MLEAAGEVPAARRSRRRKKGGLPAGYRVAEVYLERRGGRSIVGNIYKGKVDNVLPGLEAAFVDIGLDKNGFLHVDEIVLPGVERVQRGRGSGGKHTSITDLLDPGGGGAIIRTAAHGATRQDFEREMQYLFKLNEVLQKRVEETRAPAMVFQEADLSVRVVRDIFSAHFERAIVDDEKQHERLISFFSRTAPELVDRVELWEG